MWKYYLISMVAVIVTLIPSTLSIPQPQSSGLPFPSKIMSMPCSRNQQCTEKFPDSDCRNGVFCQCQKGFLEDFDKCLPVILDLVTNCSLTAQCAQGLGNLSRCNEDTHKCECWDFPGNGKNSTAHGVHTCYYRKTLGEHCDLHEECKASITPAEDVRCDVRSRTCVCADGKTCENVHGAAAILPKSVALFLIALVAVKVIH